jgi:MinD superfamily P-loop ATPase
VVASFAALAAGSVIADCDVDAADLHLVLSPKVEQQHEFRSGKEASIRQEDCMNCGMCHEFCRFDAVKELVDSTGINTYSVDPLACEGCGVCAHLCPERAIDFTEAVSGEWFVSETSHGPMVHARLGIAADNSGKLVTLVRNQARQIAVKRKLGLLLIDGPPGIGCPVIASLTGADRVLVVTEPSVSGLHDLQRVVGLARHFGIPVSVCVNKYDINTIITKEICDYCREQRLAVVGRIPFDPEVTAAQLASTSVVERDSSPAAGAIRDVWDSVQLSLKK